MVDQLARVSGILQPPAPPAQTYSCSGLFAIYQYGERVWHSHFSRPSTGLCCRVRLIHRGRKVELMSLQIEGLCIHARHGLESLDDRVVVWGILVEDCDAS